MDRHVLDTSYMSIPFQDGNGIEGHSTSYTLHPPTLQPSLQGLGSGTLLGSEPELGLGSRGGGDGYPPDLSDSYMYPSHGIEKGFGQGLGQGLENGLHEGFDCGIGRTCPIIDDYNATTTTATASATGATFPSSTTSDGKHAAKTKTNTKTTAVHGKKSKTTKKKQQLEKKQSKLDDANNKPTSTPTSSSSASPLLPPSFSPRSRPRRTIRVGFASRYFESGDPPFLSSTPHPSTPPSLYLSFSSRYPLPSTPFPLPLYTTPDITILSDPYTI